MAIRDIQFKSFQGGLNTRDAASELGPDEISDSMNVTIDERGSLTKRLGYERRFVGSLGAGLVSNVFDWASRGFLVTQEGPRMHINDSAAFLTWSTDARCGMCEFLGNLVLIHPVDGVRMYDGTTVTGPFANAPLGDTCAAWQNRCWFAGNPTHPARVTYSDIGAMTFNINGFNELREKDSTKVRCLTGAAGLDVAGRPGLLAFKAESSYRIYDSSNGAYQTIDASIGCGSNIGAVTAYGRTFVCSPRGVYWTNGLDSLIEATAKVENVFHENVINQDRPDLYCAGRYQDRLYFSFPASGDTFNSIVLEIHPLSGWVMAHSNAASAYASVGSGATDLVMGSSTVAGRVYNSHKTGADDGAAIASYIQANWIEPNFGNKVRIRRARFVGYGEFNATILIDFQSGASLAANNVDISPEVDDYDSGVVYDGGSVYGPVVFQDYEDFWSIGTARALSFRIEETSTIAGVGRSVIGQETNVLGAWTLAHLNLMVIDLGFR